MSMTRASVVPLLVALLCGASARAEPSMDASGLTLQQALSCYAVLSLTRDDPTHHRRQDVDQALLRAVEARVQEALTAAGAAREMTPFDAAFPMMKQLRDSAPQGRPFLEREFEICWLAADGRMVKAVSEPAIAQAMTCWALKSQESAPDERAFFLRVDTEQALLMHRVDPTLVSLAFDQLAAEAKRALARPGSDKIKAAQGECLTTSSAPVRAIAYRVADLPRAEAEDVRFVGGPFPVFFVPEHAPEGTGTLTIRRAMWGPFDKTREQLKAREVARGGAPDSAGYALDRESWSIAESVWITWRKLVDAGPATLCAAKFPDLGDAKQRPDKAITYWELNERILAQHGVGARDAAGLVATLGATRTQWTPFTSTMSAAREMCKAWGTKRASELGGALFVP